MQIPNLLNLALSVVGTQYFTYHKYVAREANEDGQFVSEYAPGRGVNGQVQAVPRELFEKYGLDFQGNYLMFYASKDIIDVMRDVSGDQIKFGGKTYQCISETDWFQINGWTGVLAVQISDN